MSNPLHSRYFPYWALAAVALIHRAVLFASLRVPLDTLVALNGDAWTWQHLPVSVLRDNLATGLLYLQQSPPLPELLLGCIVKMASGPAAVAHALLALQTGISTMTALMLLNLLQRLRVPTLAAMLLAAIFVLSADLVLLEYNFFGQTFYENLCMPLVLGAALAIDGFLREGRRRYLFLLGLCIGLLALMRASFGYLLVPVTVFLALQRIDARRLALFLLPVVLLQGGWMLKNLAVYRTFSLPASSWSGVNLVAGINNRNPTEGAELKALILAHAPDFPHWFVRMTRERGLVYWFGRDYRPYVPARALARDAEIAAQLPGNPPQNSVAQAVVARECGRAALLYMSERPLPFLVGVLHSYQVFWRPIREYTRYFTAPLFVRRTWSSLWDEGGAKALLDGYESGNFLVLQRVRRAFYIDEFDDFSGTLPATLWVPPYAALGVHLFDIASIHVLGPLLLIALLYRRRDIGVDPRLVAFLVLVFVYAAAVCSIGDHGENNRFRLAVEPLLWALAAAIAVGWVRWLRGERREAVKLARQPSPQLRAPAAQ